MNDLIVFIGLPVAVGVGILIGRRILTGRFIGPAPDKKAKAVEAPAGDPQK